MNMQHVSTVAEVSIVERWMWWQNALKAPDKIGSATTPIHPGEYQLGYYRTRSKGGQWEPVGIYPDESGLVSAWRAGEAVDDIPRLFEWCCRNPISYDAYVKALDGGGFDDEPPAGLGHNATSDDPLEAIRLELLGEIETASEFMRAEVKSQADADKAGIWAKRFTDLSKRADNHRVVEKEPHLAASRAVDDRWRDPIAEAKDWAAKLKRHVEGFLIAQKRAEEERQRKAREEAEMLRRQAAEEARRANESDQKSAQERERANENAARLAEQAAAAEAEAEARKVNAGRTGARVSVRVEKVGVVTDYGKAAAALVAMKHPDMLAEIDRLAKAAAKKNFPFDGMEIKEEERVV
jgi:hypothetical protein